MRNILSKPIFVGLIIAGVASASAGYIAWEAMQRIMGHGQNQTVGTTGAIHDFPDLGGPFALLNAAGAPVTETSFGEKSLLIYFGFTYCPDVCPTDLAIMAQAYDIMKESDRESADRVQPIFVTIDPERDTPDVAGAYATAFHPDFVGLSGGMDAVEEAAGAFKVYYAKRMLEQDGSEEQDYLMDHSAFTYLFTPGKGVQTIFRRGITPADMAQTVAERLPD